VQQEIWGHKYDFLSSVLESLEVKKLFMFSGCGLGQYEDVVAKSNSNAEMLENSGADKDGGWLRRDYCFPGETSKAGGVDQLPGVEGRDRCWV
jgi:hypothetical protein